MLDHGFGDTFLFDNKVCYLTHATQHMLFNTCYRLYCARNTSMSGCVLLSLSQGHECMSGCVAGVSTTSSVLRCTLFCDCKQHDSSTALLCPALHCTVQYITTHCIVPFVQCILSTALYFAGPHICEYILRTTLHMHSRCSIHLLSFQRFW